MGVLQTYAIGTGVLIAEDIYGDIYGRGYDSGTVNGEAIISFVNTSDGDGPERNRIISFSEIFAQDIQESEFEGTTQAVGKISFIALKAFEDAMTVEGITELRFVEIGKEIFSQSIACGSEISSFLSVSYLEDLYEVVGKAFTSAKDDFISPSNSSLVQGFANIIDKDLYSAVDGGYPQKDTWFEWSPTTTDGLCSGEAIIRPFEKDIATPEEYRVRLIDGLITSSSQTVGSMANHTYDQYYGLTSTENPFPPPLTAHPEYGQVGDGIAIGVGVIKYNKDNFAIVVGTGFVSSTESIGHSDSLIVVGNSKISAEDLFPTYGTVIGYSHIQEISEVTMLNKPAQSYIVVITGATGDGTQIVYEAINNLEVGESVTITRNHPSSPADWWDLGPGIVIESATSTSFTVLSSNTGDYSNVFGESGYVSPENDGYAVVTSSANRYGPDGLQRYPSPYEDFKYSISAIEIFTYQAALSGFSGGSSVVDGDLVGAPFVMVGSIVNVVPITKDGVINYRGSVSDQYGLPSLDNSVDDCFYLEDESSFRLWNGSAWIAANGVSGELTVFGATGTSGYGGQGNPAGIYGTGVYT